jgi:cold-inducible RNA-binding protein
MSARLFVGNLPFSTTTEQLQDLFASHGGVEEVDVIKDKFTGKSRGFAFVTMATKEAAEAAAKALNGQALDGRAMTVNEARPREERPRPSGGDRGYRGGRSERREYR